MEAANRGAYEIGAPSIGFNITLPTEQEPNAYTTPELTFQFHYFAMRKMHLAMRANGLVIFPGGFGTFDELFEILNLVQTGKAPHLPIVLFGSDVLAKGRELCRARRGRDGQRGGLRALRFRRHGGRGMEGARLARLDGAQQQSTRLRRRSGPATSSAAVSP